MDVILTEKYSVARDYVIPALGGVSSNHSKYSQTTKSTQGYVITASNQVVVWCQGHLLTTDYSASGANLWKLDKLPFYTEVDKLVFVPESKTKSQVELIGKLMAQIQPTESFIIATDCEAEGELIARELIEYHKYTGRVMRLWSNDSMTVANMKKNLSDLKPGSDFDYLHCKAKYRNFTDFFIGINLTEIATVAGRQILGDKSKTAYSIGRVQTPLLCAIAKREGEIESFTSSLSYRLVQNFTSDSHQYSSDILLNGNEDLSSFVDSPDASNNLNLMSSVQSSIVSALSQGKFTVNKVEDKPNKYSPPLFSLTTLQKHMNKVAGWSAVKTESVADSLYKAGLSSYPRTSGQYLSEDWSIKNKYVKIIQSFIPVLSTTRNVSVLPDDVVKDKVLSSGRRLFNLQALKDTDAAHDAYIIETDRFFTAKLTPDQKLLGEEVIKRMIQVVFSPVETYKVSYTLTVDLAGSGIKLSDGSELTSATTTLSGTYVPGLDNPDEYSDWRRFYTDNVIQTENETLFNSAQPTPTDVRSREVKTKAPSPFTAITVLDWLEKNRLGTAATRTTYLANLIDKGYVFLQSKAVKLTDKGKIVYDIFKSSEFSSDECTTTLEDNITRLAKGELSELDYTSSLFTKMVTYKDDIINGLKNTTLTPSSGKSTKVSLSCPACSQPINEIGYMGVKCQCGFSFPRKMLGKTFTDNDIIKLVTTKTLPVKGMTSKKGKKFNTVLVLDNNAQLQFTF